MKEDAIKRIHTIGRVGVIITNIYRVLIIVLMLIILVGTIGLFMIPKDLLTLQFDSTVNLQIDPSAVPGDSSDATVKNNLISLSSLFEAGSLFLVYADGTTIPITVSTLDTTQYEDGMHLDVRTTTPQTRTLTMQDLAWLLVVVLLYLVMSLVTICFIGSLCTAVRYCDSPFDATIIRRMTSFAFSLIPWVFLSSLVNSVSNSITTGGPHVSLSINLGMILIILVIFALTLIFKYGAVLQQESDETL